MCVMSVLQVNHSVYAEAARVLRSHLHMPKPMHMWQQSTKLSRGRIADFDIFMALDARQWNTALIIYVEMISVSAPFAWKSSHHMPVCHGRLACVCMCVCQKQRDARTDDAGRMRAHSKLQYVS